MTTRTEISDQDMVDLWAFMEELYGPVFTSMYGKKVKEWKRHFIRLRLTPGHIELGKEKCRQQMETMPPNLSAFTGRCQPTPEELGLPSEDEAYFHAVRNEWVHPLVWHAKEKVGPYTLRHDAESKTKPKFIKEYRELFRRFVAGELFTIARREAPALPPPPCKTSVEQAYDDLEKIIGRKPCWKPKTVDQV